MAKRRSRKSRENPSVATWAVLGLGAAAVGVGIYFLVKPSSSSTDSAKQLRPFGDPTDGNSIAYACNAAWRLNAIGHPREAAPWAAKCTGGGGTVPTSNAGVYT